MKMKSSVVLAACLGVLVLASGTLSAHHSFAAEFDANKPVTLKGKVTKVELINPHGWLYMDVVDADGKTTNWRIETTGPNALLRRGWRKDTVQVGFDVVVQGFLARDGSPTANGTSVLLPSGQKLFMGAAGPDDQPKRN
jgi:hypothetical protein